MEEIENNVPRPVQKARALARSLHHCEVKYITTAVLMDLNVKPNLHGYRYLKQAIILYYEDPTKGLLKDIYPMAARACNSQISGSQVDKLIHSAIVQAWNGRNRDVWTIYFPADAEGEEEIPTNSDFLSRIACFLELWEGCCKGVEYEKSKE